jgi:hypothetical protein
VTGSPECHANPPAPSVHAMDLVVSSSGQVHCIYDELIDLSTLGTLAIRRASHVEPDDHGRWWADLKPVDGPILGPFSLRSDALAAERHWLNQSAH